MFDFIPSLGALAQIYLLSTRFDPAICRSISFSLSYRVIHKNVDPFDTAVYFYKNYSIFFFFIKDLFQSSWLTFTKEDISKNNDFFNKNFM